MLVHNDSLQFPAKIIGKVSKDPLSSNYLNQTYKTVGLLFSGKYFHQTQLIV